MRADTFLCVQMQFQLQSLFCFAGETCRKLHDVWSWRPAPISANGIDASSIVFSKNSVQDSHEQKDTELLSDQNPRSGILV